jgi:PhoPQ-activated pathogenicity-related protein
MKAVLYAWMTVLALSGSIRAEETALDQYVAKPDGHYSFTHYHSDEAFGYTTHFLEMTSQQWRSAEEVDRPIWSHAMQIVVPWEPLLQDKRTAILIIDGGRNGRALPKNGDDALGLLAGLARAVIVVVKQVPNQPLRFADEADRPRKEDDILAYSFDKYLDTGDEEWPVHLAMTKAVVRAMDAAQTFMRALHRIDDFVLIGGSKRGWTAWLTAAVDKRAKAIVPISIDLLNMAGQFDRQWRAYGYYSPAIDAYLEFDLPCRVNSPAGRALLRIVDPYYYRDRYTMPKLIINSAGDQFFLPDSSQLYFSALPEPKLVRYSVNTDHQQHDLDVALSALAWIDELAEGKSGPAFTWSLEPDGSIRVKTATKPKQVLLWHATNPEARDFRLETIGAAWTRRELEPNADGEYIGRVVPPEKGWTAYTVELVFEGSGVLQGYQAYTTDVRVMPDDLPYRSSACSPLTQARAAVQ